jgi:hypothetical protein
LPRNISLESALKVRIRAEQHSGPSAKRRNQPIPIRLKFFSHFASFSA